MSIDTRSHQIYSQPEINYKSLINDTRDAKLYANVWRATQNIIRTNLCHINLHSKKLPEQPDEHRYAKQARTNMNIYSDKIKHQSMHKQDKGPDHTKPNAQ